nr:Unknown Function [uncultured bacterium]
MPSCLDTLQVEAKATCLLDNGGSFAATVKVTNPCDHAVDVELVIAHEAGPTSAYTVDWVGVNWQILETVTLQPGGSRVFEGGSPKHPSKYGWYLLIARLISPAGGWTKVVHIGEPAPICYPFFTPTTVPAVPTRTSASKGTPVFKSWPTTTAEAITPETDTSTPIRTATHTPVPRRTSTPVVGGTTSAAGTSNKSLMGATVDSLLPFFAPFLLGGLLVVIDQVINYRRSMRRRDHGRIWWTWFVSMLSGGVSLAVATMAGPYRGGDCERGSGVYSLR